MMRGIISYYSLFLLLHADCHARLEPELQVVVVDGHLFQQLLRQSLIKLCDVILLKITHYELA